MTSLSQEHALIPDLRTQKNKKKKTWTKNEENDFEINKNGNSEVIFVVSASLWSKKKKQKTGCYSATKYKKNKKQEQKL